jgi:hypothetical protein
MTKINGREKIMTTGSKPMEFVKLVANIMQKQAHSQSKLSIPNLSPSQLYLHWLKEPGHYTGTTEFEPFTTFEIILDDNDNPIVVDRRAPTQLRKSKKTQIRSNNSPASNKIATTGQGQATASQAAAAQVVPGQAILAAPGVVPGQAMFAAQVAPGQTMFTAPGVVPGQAMFAAQVAPGQTMFTAPGAPPATGLAGGSTQPKTSLHPPAASPRTAVHPPVAPGQVIVAPPPGAVPGQVILATPGIKPATPSGVGAAPPQGAGGPTPSGSAPSPGLGWKGALAAIALSALASHLFGRYMGTPSGEEFAETKRLIEALKAQLRSQQHMLETAPYHYANIHALANTIAARQDMTEALANMLMQMAASRQQAPQTIFI